MDDFKPAPVKTTVPFADLEKLDIRVGGIVAVEDVPKSGKLLRLTVDFGDHRRTILAGMKGERADPQALVGLQAFFVGRRRASAGLARAALRLPAGRPGQLSGAPVGPVGRSGRSSCWNVAAPWPSWSGPLDEKIVPQVQTARSSQRWAWAKRLLSASTLEEVFG